MLHNNMSKCLISHSSPPVFRFSILLKCQSCGQSLLLLQNRLLRLDDGSWCLYMHLLFNSICDMLLNYQFTLSHRCDQSSTLWLHRKPFSLRVRLPSVINTDRDVYNLWSLPLSQSHSQTLSQCNQALHYNVIGIWQSYLENMKQVQAKCKQRDVGHSQMWKHNLWLWKSTAPWKLSRLALKFELYSAPMQLKWPVFV